MPTKAVRAPVKLLKHAAVAALLVAIGFAAITWWALEWDGVAIIETRAADGTVRSTHVWYAEPDGELWLEAGTPENPWFRDIHDDPAVTLHAGALSGGYLAHLIEAESGHGRIRSLLGEKYGLRDRWVGLLVDTSRSVAVKLTKTAR